MSDEIKVGLKEDEVCNRDGCKGVMEIKPSEDCSCHISPPCSSCMEAPIYCPECEKEVPYE